MNSTKKKLEKQAHDAALKGDFELAIAVNQELININESDIDAQLRLAFAYLQSGDHKKSASIYRAVLKNEPTNFIARNNLEKISVMEKKGTKKSDDQDHKISNDPNLFIHVTGKTKEVELANIGQASVLAALKIGQEVYVSIRKRRVEVRTAGGEYIGCLPDDVSKRMMYFINSGSTYSIFVKASSKSSVEVFVREESRGRKVRNYLSFPKNISDDLKSMSDRTDHTDSEPSEPDDEGLHDMDLDVLAEQIDEEESIDIGIPKMSDGDEYD